MSGIAGIMNLNGEPIDGDLLGRMTEFMSSRGPDAQKIWIDGNIGLGHTMLRTTFESETENQPLTIDRKVWLTADARIDDREALIEKLQDKLGRSLTRERIPNDAELILFAYEGWGAECVKHLIGDFAFAIWDTRSQRLFCARDHFGVKPFFFAHICNTFIFSNTLNALRLEARVSDALNEIAIGDYLLFGVNQDLSTTTFRDINRLPPGHTLTISDGSLSTNRYWTPANTGEVRFRDRRSYVERFAELLSSAIDDRIRTNRISVSMSGGLDSTSVATIARERLRGDPAVHAYSIVYDSLIPDQERYYSSAAANHLGIPITHINADRYSLYDEQIPGDMNQAEPFLLSALTGQFHDLLRLCADYGRVALTGWDGDAFMSEPPKTYFVSSAKKLKLKDLARGIGWYVWTQKRFPPVGLRTRLRRILGKRASAGFYPEWIDEPFAKRINLRERLQECSTSPVAAAEMRPSALQALNSKVWASLFEGYDAGATKLQLELRHPFIDLRLVEYLLALPAVPWCVNKHILRLTMKNRLPESVINRPKTGLAGDPALQLTRHASVIWLDSFEVSPQLKCFVNLDARRSIVDERTSDGLWASLRVFALNYWLTNSQPIDRLTSAKQVNKIEPVTETSIA
jgi:asparagine synthase (glutamine-hydrolysing)